MKACISVARPLLEISALQIPRIQPSHVKLGSIVQLQTKNFCAQKDITAKRGVKKHQNALLWHIAQQVLVCNMYLSSNFLALKTWDAIPQPPKHKCLLIIYLGISITKPSIADKAALSWVGFILLAAVLVVLWMSYLLMIAALRVSQRRLARTQLARERLWKLLTPLLASQHHSKIQSFRAFKAIRPKITLEFENLGLTLHDGTPILSGVSGSFTHSRVAAIMGPSGAGKSTFLNVIMGKAAGLGKVSGKMKANKREMRPDALRGIVGFVPQEDIVHEDLTVRENLVYSARLRLSATKPLKEQLAIVDDVINVLQLRHVQHQVVGTAERRGISGGQRKRVNIGMELVAKPSILFMDEPTSGLDATAAADILGALKRMAGLGMNIITVIHQPRYSIFSLFDDVMLLCKGGRLAYLGPSRLALPYLESAGFQLPPNENPADFALDVLSGSVPRLGFPAFQPEDLVPLWQKYGAGWVDQQEAARASLPTGEGSSIRVAAEAVDPEQLRLLEQGFDQVDGDGDSAINGGELQTMLVKLGVEPTSADVQMIVTELADAQSGLISKHAFLQYVRYGGRPPTSDPSEQQGEAQRRVDSLYRVYSIEQYSLGSALAEIAAAQLPEGLKVGPNGGTSSLKNMATAANVDQQPSSTMMKQSTRSTATTGIAPASKSASVDVSTRPPTIPEGKESISSEETATTMRTSSNGSVASLQLPPSSQDHIKRNSLMPDMHRDSMVITDMGDVPIQHSLRWKFMWLLGLEAGGGTLRNTPGTFRQLLVLFSRASIKWTRNWAVKFMDILMLIVAAVICGGMHGTGSTPNDVRGHAALIMLTLGVLSATTSLSVFGKDRLIFWRERSSGIAVLSYFLANTALSLIDVALQPLVFLSIYQSMTLPTLPFAMHYLIGMLVVWWTSSAGCLISILAGQQATALIASVTVVLVTGGFINGVNPNYRQLSTTTKAMTALSYNRWAVEAITIASYKYYPEYLWPVTKALVNFAGYCGLDEAGIPVVQAGALKGSVSSTSDVVLKQQNINVYCKGYLANALVVLAMEGLVLRLVTLLALYICPRGVTLEPLAVALGSVFAKMKLLMRTRTKRRTATGNGVVGGV